jgi:hypothetical protein
VKEVILFTLKAQAVEIQDDAKTYKCFVLPSVSHMLPVRSAPAVPELLHVESADSKTRRMLSVKRRLMFCCDPAVEAILTLDYRREIKQLKDSSCRLQVSLDANEDRRYRWARLPLWRRLWTVLTCYAPY